MLDKPQGYYDFAKTEEKYSDNFREKLKRSEEILGKFRTNAEI